MPTDPGIMQSKSDAGEDMEERSSRSKGLVAVVPSSGNDNSGFLSATSRRASKYSTTRSSATPYYDLESSKLAMLDKPCYVEGIDIMGKRKLKKKQKEESERTKGVKWFNMQAPELTQERKNDLEALRLRGALDTKHFYKRNNLTHQPKYFQIGKIVEGPADYYNSRVPKRQRKKTLADEMVAEMSRNHHGSR